MGFPRRILRARRDRAYPVLPARSWDGRRRGAGAHCDEAKENAHAGCARLAAEALTRNAAHSGDVIDPTPRGKRRGRLLAIERRRVPRAHKCLPMLASLMRLS